MISNLRIAVAELVVWALLAAAGLTWLLLGIGRGLERAWGWWVDRPRIMWIRDWWYDRRREDDDWQYEEPLKDWEGDSLEDVTPLLAPEQTWEQMTSHQLPIVGMSAPERKHWQRLERARKRRARLVETTHRAHYAAMGLDYPSGLMARVRELTP